MNLLMLKMGGTGTRFGSQVPKQYSIINDEPLFTLILRQYLEVDKEIKFLIICHRDWIDYARKYAEDILGDKLIAVIEGGDTGAKSIYNGVMYASGILNDSDILLTHDASNPMVDIANVKNVIEAAESYDFAALCTEQVHTIYRMSGDLFVEDTIDRKKVCSGYSPEAFKFKRIYDCYSKASDEELNNMTSAIALAKMYNAKTKIIMSNTLNLKITYKNDFETLKLLFENKR